MGNRALGALLGKAPFTEHGRRFALETVGFGIGAWVVGNGTAGSGLTGRGRWERGSLDARFRRPGTTDSQD